eukprot:scaffold1155_cov92-Amphora_coffeaeformis.AAC.2
MGSLRDLDVSGNSFTGVLPLSLGNIPNLRSLKLQFNQFEGNVPDEYCDIGFALEADCLPQIITITLDGETSPPGDSPSNFCLGGACCTTCCDRVTGACLDFVGDNIGGIDRCDGYFDWNRGTGEVSGFFLEADYYDEYNEEYGDEPIAVDVYYDEPIAVDVYYDEPIEVDVYYDEPIEVDVYYEDESG